MYSEDEAIKQNIKTNLRKFREANGFTQTQIGIILGTGRTTYTKWESGDTLPNPVQLAMLASIYNKSVNDFYRDENGFTVCSTIFDEPYTNHFLSELNDDEKMLLSKFRLLNDDEKKKVSEYIEAIDKD